MWSDTTTDPDLNTSGINLRYANMLGATVPTAHFVIDTSRNGNGPLERRPYAAAPYNQPANVISALTSGNWCNPPGAGLGLRPTANTGVALLDAYLWVKIPGESDGTVRHRRRRARLGLHPVQPLERARAPPRTTFDPLWGMVDPAAGLWFPQQALQLAQNATPPLL